MNVLFWVTDFFDDKMSAEGGNSVPESQHLSIPHRSMWCFFSATTLPGYAKYCDNHHNLMKGNSTVKVDKHYDGITTKQFLKGNKHLN